MGGRGYFPATAITALLAVTANTATWTDLDVSGATTSARAISVRFLAEVHDNTPGAGVFAAFRKNGVTTDSLEIRVYPQVVGISVQQIVEVELDANQVLEYALFGSGATSANLALHLMGYEERW